MTIKKSDYAQIIGNINIGNSIAEDDFLLESARVETPVFKGVIEDKYDIVLGRKGAGKTAIFKLVNLLSEHLLSRDNLVILSGVNSSGESLFNKFKEQFKDYSEEDFENFWKLYFINLIYNQFLKEPKFEKKLETCEKEIKDFKSACYKAGIPDIKSIQGMQAILAWSVNALKSVKLKVPISYDAKNQTLFALPELKIEKGVNKEDGLSETKSLYVHDIGFALGKILHKSGFHIWIILDRLDEVFDRYSAEEFNGLRGLLRAYKSFDIGVEGNFRIKLFLRDDIKSFLTDAKSYEKHFPKKELPPLVAATHIFSKESPTLSWSEDEIEQLILNRLLLGLNIQLRDYLGINEKYVGLKKSEIDKKLEEELRNKQSRKEYWNKIFPSKISSTDSSLKWIFSHLKDSNDIVTPRSVIDMLEGAINFQKQKMQTDFQDSSVVFPIESIKAGLDIASEHKLLKDIYNEFPKEQGYIKLLSKEGQFKLSKSDLERLFGKDWENIVTTLRKIGILRYVKNSEEFRIVHLFRPALGVSYRY
ncbi:MAG: hypothetical protein PHQ59_02495 [Candidatus Daviesbacteria bacterium]|nr:hypothetical protein [Candidatus Daviesbacteria bacterium]